MKNGVNGEDGCEPTVEAKKSFRMVHVTHRFEKTLIVKLLQFGDLVPKCSVHSDFAQLERGS